MDNHSKIVACVQRSYELPKEFDARFNGAIKRHGSVSWVLFTSSSGKFAVLMLRSASITPDTRHSNMCELTTSSKRPLQDIFLEMNYEDSYRAVLCNRRRWIGLAGGTDIKESGWKLYIERREWIRNWESRIYNFADYRRGTTADVCASEYKEERELRRCKKWRLNSVHPLVVQRTTAGVIGWNVERRCRGIENIRVVKAETRWTYEKRCNHKNCKSTM